MELKKCWKEYADYLKQKGYTKRTQENYLWLLNKFLEEMSNERIQTIGQVTEEKVQNYIGSRYYYINNKGKQNTIGSRNNEMKIIKHFFKVLKELEITDQDFGKAIEYLKKPKGVIPQDILNKREIKKLLNLPDTKDILGYRDRMMLEILYGTGIRREELGNIRIKDIDLNQGELKISKGKGQKDRIVPLTEAVIKYIDNYIEKIRPKIIKKQRHDYLLISRNGRQLKGQDIYDILKKYFQKMGKKKISCHSLRHTTATHLLQAGMPIRHVQELLGHKDLDSTMLYLQLDIKDLQREYRKCHPRERSN